MLEGYKGFQNIFHSQSTEILRATREADGLPVILKIRSGLASRERKAGLVHEYELGKTLEGEHLVKHLAVEHTAHKSILVSQDDKMNSLATSIPEKGFDLSHFFNLAIEIVSAIEEIHSQGVIHKDINPSNIIVNPAFDAVTLIDFGSATRVCEEIIGFEPPAVLQGTISYISPEQTGRVNKTVDSRSDLYSVGVTFYRLITGKLPFDDVNPGELIYSHIARTPVPVFEIRQDIPQAVSLVIEKLLRKSPDKRYQTAAGLKDDLRYLQKVTSEGKQIVDFIPEKNRQTGRLLFPGKLYGREKESARLLDCFGKSHDTGQVVTVTGPAGIGKTALIRELYSPITSRNGFFLSGKFDQLNKGLAYTAFADALRDFIQQCSGQDEETTTAWRNTVQSSVGDFGQVLTGIIPEVQNLIGKQQSIAPVSPLETVARRNSVFSNLIKDICAVGRPLVMFLDDLQWSDSSTLSLLETIIDIKLTNLLIILSYRDNEISPAHPARQFLDDIDSKDIEFMNLHLSSLSSEAVSELVSDILPERDKEAEELSSLVMNRTEGNPFYITSFLHMVIENRYIRRDKDGVFSLDMNSVTSIPVEADVVEYLIKKIESLKPRDMEFLTHVSILGNRFSLDTIHFIFDEGDVRYADVIQELVREHLLIKSGENLLFSHDRVQQAARALLDDDKARALHLKAAKNTREALDAQGLAHEAIEKYIYHYNAAAELVTDVKQRLELAKLNTMLGKRLKGNAAYQAAEISFNQAVSFLPPQPFGSNYKMAIDLFIEYGETLFLNLKYEEGEKHFKTVITHSKSPLDSARVYVKQISHYAANNNLDISMKIALDALKTLGANLPKRLLKLSVIADLLRTKNLLKNKAPEDVLDFPTTEDPLVLAQMDVLSAAAAPAYIGYPDYYPIIIFKMMGITIANGACDMSSFAYVNYAVVLCSLGEADAGYSYGRAALALLEKLGAKHLLTKVSYMFGLFVHHWKAPARDSIKFFEAAISGGLKNGDYDFASFAANDVMSVYFYYGRSIDSMLSQYPKQHKILEGFGKDHAISVAKFRHQLLITLNDPKGDGKTISGDITDERQLIPLLEERQDLSSLGVCMIAKLLLAYLAGDYELANTLRVRAVKLLKALPGTMDNTVCHLFAALTCISIYRENGNNSALIRDAKRSLKKLQKWGNDAPENYLHKAELVEAELLSATGRQSEALKLYESAIENAEKAQNSMDLGIACECMGRHLESIGLKSNSLIYIRRSISVFHNWGAYNKSRKLSKELGIEISEKDNLPWETAPSRSSQDISVYQDLDALVGNIKSLTSVIEYDSLLTNLLDTVMQRSGATRVIYIRTDQDTLQVKAEKPKGGDVRIYEGKETQPASFDLPTALLEKYCFGKNDYLLENIKVESPYDGNAQQESKLKSILIIPLIRQQSVSGLIYLENNLMEDAFRQDHIQFLSLLAGQAAIAIENALVFERLSAEREYSSNIIQKAPGLICGVDGEGLTTFVNPATTEVTGYSKEELIGENWWELFYTGEEYEQVRQLFKAFPGGEVVDYEMTLTCKNGKRRNIVWNSISKRDNNDNILELIRFGNDLTKRKQAESALRESEEKFRTFMENSTDASSLYDSNLCLVEVNKAGMAMFPKGTKKEDVIGRSLLELDPTLEGSERHRNYQEVIRTGKPLIIENLIPNPDWGDLRLSVRLFRVDDRLGMIVTDITDQRRVEDQIKASLSEKETLLKEIHHRVKNNMQVIISLLKIQSRNIKDEKYLNILRESQDRIRTMAIVHEKLYKNENLAAIRFKEYVESLVSDLFRTYGRLSRRVVKRVEVEDISLGIECATPCGLIINELVTNSLKYAFPNEREGKILVALEKNNEDEILLTVSDNGVGIPEELDVRNTESMGLHLVKILSEDQLEGKMEIERHAGTSFHISFKKYEYKARI